MKINEHIIINAPPGFIFSALFNPILKRLWNRRFVDSTFEYSNLMKSESASLRFTETYKDGNSYEKYQAEVVHVFKAEYFSYKYHRNDFDVIVEYSLMNRKNYTELKRATEIIYKSWFSKLMAKVNTRANNFEELNNLKNYVENRLLFFCLNITACA